jgi:hypothetical protein
MAAWGQTFRGAINGTVTDPSGALVSDAQVTATEKSTGVVHTTVTTSGGEFSFQDIDPGAYVVSVVAKGFQKLNVENVTVTAGQVYTVPAKLTMGQESATIDVAAAALEIDTTTTTQSDTIPSTQLQDIPMNGRDFSQLIAVAPGYGGYAVGGFGSLNGTRANQMNWQIDGTDNNDFWHNIPAVNQGGVSGIAGVVMPVDAIDEFSAQTQSNAESGRNAGGTVNLTIKSGTNNIHGTAYYYNRNEAFAAASPFVPAGDRTPELRNYNTGFTVGGPIVKDKTFLFIGFEKERYIFGLSGANATEPSNAWVDKAQALLTANAVADSAISQRLLSTLWPSSISGLPAQINNYFATNDGTGYSYNGVARLDENFNANNHLSVHWFAGQGSQTQPPGASLALATASSNLGYYFEVAPIHVQNYSAVFNSVLTSKLTNQVLFGVSYFNQVFHDSNNSFNMAALGLPLSSDATINGNPIYGASNIQIAGFDQVGITPPEGRNDVTGHLTDVVSYISGKHQFRLGGEVRQGRVDEFYYRNSLGSFSFNGAQGPWANNCVGSTDLTCPATIALADYLAGYVSSSNIAVGDAERKVTVNGFDFFGQDDWQITKKLNLNLGLRYEYFGPLHNGNKNLSVFIPGQGLVIQGDGINSIFPADKNNFAPRFGFAYQPTEKADFVVRGGIGVFYDQINMNPFLDYRPPSGADGLEDNPAGPHAVDSYATPLNAVGGATQYQWDNQVATNGYIFPGVTTCPGLAGGTGCGTSTFNAFSVSQNFRAPYFFNYNLNIEKGLGDAAVFQIGYVGSVGHKLSIMENINQNGAYNAAYPNVGTINQLNSVGNSNYNSLQSTLRLRSYHGFTAQLGYTWAHALDEATEYRGILPLNSFDLAAEYGNSDFDTRQNFTAFWTYDIPGSSHGPKMLTHGWQISSLWSFHGGQPFNFNAGTQRPGLNLVSDPFAGVSHTFNPSLPGEQWVNPAAFCVPGAVGCPGTTDPAGNVARNAFYGPGYADVDLSVIKNIQITERFKIQLRAEMFNLFNRKNLATGAASVGSNGVVADTIGDFNGAPGLGPGEPFNMQLVGKIIF